MVSKLGLKNTILAFLLTLTIIFLAILGTKINPKELGKAIERLGKVIKDNSKVLAQEAEFSVYPRYPQRLMVLSSYLLNQSEDLFSLNQELNELIKTCDCRYAQSACVGGKSPTQAQETIQNGLKATEGCQPSSVGAFGDPCLNVREEVEQAQSKIEGASRQILFLQSLLKKEMESGAKGELEKILKKEDFEEIKKNIEKVIQESQNLISQGSKNKDLAYQNPVNKCSANCNLGNIFGLKACLAIGTGEQRAIELKFKAGVSLNDLDLGKIEIRGLNLALPEKIELPKFGSLSSFTILGEKIIIDLEKKETLEIKAPTLKLQVPELPSLPKSPVFSFSCANLASYFSSFSCQPPPQREVEESAENEWYFQILSWLMESCANLPTITDPWQFLKEKAENCYDPEKVIQTINQECRNIWENYCKEDEKEKLPPPPICQKIRVDCGDINGEIATALQCQELFKKEGLEIPSQCQSIIANPADENPCPNPKYPQQKDGLCVPENFNPLPPLENKCQELKKKYPKEPPQPCKILPLFLGKIEKPAEETYLGNLGNCQAQKISDAPPSIPGCGPSPLTIPKIKLPKIIIPDIHLPYFRIPPFLEVKLPSFIFEDLVLPDIDLCNLDNCQEIFPDLRFQLPILSLPTLDLPPIELGEVLGVPLPSIQLSPIRLPSFPLPYFRLPSIGNIIMPELNLPALSLPQPKTTFAFEGLDLSAVFAYIKTFILNALGVPDGALCIDFRLNIIPLRIIFPDYYFYWPEFPKIPEIPFCQDIREFCQTSKTKLKEVSEKTKIIEKTFNQFFEENIQKKLNQTAKQIQEKYKTYILQEIEKQKGKIKQKIEEQIKRGEKKIVIELEPIKVPAIPLDQILNLPEEIPIPWPEALKKINLTQPLVYNLPKIPLSKLSYEKEVIIKGPGFQERTLTFKAGAYGDCLAGPPTGGNPYPISQFQTNLSNLEKTKNNLQEAAREIIRILQVRL